MFICTQDDSQVSSHRCHVIIFLFVTGEGVEYGAVRALVDLFYTCEASAKEHEAHTDQIIDRDLDQSSRAKKKKEEKEDDLDETVTKCELQWKNTSRGMRHDYFPVLEYTVFVHSVVSHCEILLYW